MTSTKDCLECSNPFSGLHFNQKVCAACKELRAARLNNKRRGIVIQGDEVLCPACDKKFRLITGQHIKTHGFFDAEEFKKYFGITSLAAPSKRKTQSEFMQDNNPTVGGHSASLIEKISKNRIGKGLGVAGKYTRTPEIREKISKGVIKFYRESTDFKSGILVHAEKTFGSPIVVRSTWEARVVKILDRHPCVQSYTFEPFVIKYFFKGVWRRYIPDFLIKFEGNIKEVWEVKPERDFIKPQNIAKFAALVKFCEENKSNSRIVTLDQIEAMEMQVGLRPWRGPGRPWVRLDDPDYRPNALDLELSSKCTPRTPEADFGDLEGQIEELLLEEQRNANK